MRIQISMKINFILIIFNFKCLKVTDSITLDILAVNHFKTFNYPNVICRIKWDWIFWHVDVGVVWHWQNESAFNWRICLMVRKIESFISSLFVLRRRQRQEYVIKSWHTADIHQNRSLPWVTKAELPIIYKDVKHKTMWIIVGNNFVIHTGDKSFVS